MHEMHRIIPCISWFYPTSKTEVLIYEFKVYASCTALVALRVANIFQTRVSHRYVAATVNSRRV